MPCDSRMARQTPTGPSPETYRRKRSRKSLFILVGIVALVASTAFASFVRSNLERRAAHNLQNPVAPTPDVLGEAKSSYDSHCASCHGSKGDGKGDKAQGLWSAPTDFRDRRLLRRTDGDLYWVTTKGNWPMPAFESKLSDLERWQLVDYIRTFEAGGSSPDSH